MADTVKLAGDSPQRVALELMQMYTHHSKDGVPENEKEFIKLYRKFYAATFYNPEEVAEDILK